MNWTARTWLLLLLATFSFACKNTQPIASAPTPAPEEVPIDEPRAIVEMQLTPDWAPKYFGEKPSHTRLSDLIHTRLHIRFDWSKQHVLGQAELTLKPYFYPTDKLVLDAKGFDIHEIALLDSSGTQTTLDYTYDKLQLTIQLDRTYTREESYQLFVDYTAKPTELETTEGVAITSDQGLYFIDPEGTDPYRPTQLWTQGEPQASSCWFPTIDWPNERCTQEIFLTVEDKYVTVSNGKLVSSEQQENGLRTDHWKQDLPHAPYLFALAVGEFEVTHDSWRDKEVNYYMEPEYAPYAQTIFGDTPEMIEFFSNALKVDYPWDKYAQIVVRDFVSGAMENTGCVIFYDALNQNARQNMDERHQDIIAHELFHHWFGDLVTMESFANLPLNESFATYGEALWFRHKLGQDAADEHLDQDLQNYLNEAETKREPLIRYAHKNPDDMFDAHSYQKGGRVLHMLFHLVGEEAFWASLNRYLTVNAYSDVEIHELRLAFEDVTGRDLRWFFDQWFLEPGHPELDLSYRVQKGTNGQEVLVTVDQFQDLRYMPVYRLPVDIQITSKQGEVQLFPVDMITRDTTFVIPYAGEVGNVIFDAGKILLAVTEEVKPEAYWKNQLKYGQNFKQKQEAIAQLTASIKDDEVVDLLLARLKDEFWATRLQALEALATYGQGARQKRIVREFMALGQNDPKSDVRKAAIQTFASEEVMKFAAEREMTEALDAMIISGLQDSSYNVQAAALQTLTFRSPMEAVTLAKEFAQAPGTALMGISTLILIQINDPKDFDTILNNLRRIPTSLEQAQILQGFGPYLRGKTPEQQQAATQVLMPIGENGQVGWIRLMALQVLQDYTSDPEVQAFFRQRAKADADEEVKAFCEQVVGR